MKRKLVFLLPVVALLIGLLPLVVSAGGPWSDNFDSYANGTVLQGVGGWKGWDNVPAAAGVVDNAFASSAPNSVRIDFGMDAVHEYTASSGQWTFGGEIYIPGNFGGTSYFIMLNIYNDGGPYNWSVQSNFNSATGQLTDDGSGLSMAYITDQWVPFRVEIDLDADTQSYYYNDTLLYSGVWNGYISGPGGGANVVAAVDLYANGATPIYYDNLYFTSPVTSIALDKTVGLDPSVCAATDNVTIPAGGGGTEVTYCYTMLNTGDFTVTYHTVEDSELGTVLGPNAIQDVGPGGSFFFTTTTLITQTTVNTATWYINDDAGAVITSSTDTATVTRGNPTDVSLSAFGADGGFDATLVGLGALLVVVAGLGVALRRKATAQ